MYSKGEPFYHCVENRPDSDRFLDEGLLKPVRPENVRYQIIQNIPTPPRLPKASQKRFSTLE